MRLVLLLIASLLLAACNRNAPQQGQDDLPIGTEFEKRVRAHFPKLPNRDPWATPPPAMKATVVVFPFVAPDGGTTADTINQSWQVSRLLQVAAPAGVGSVYHDHVIQDVRSMSRWYPEGRIFPDEKLYPALARFYGATHWVTGVVTSGPEENQRRVEVRLHAPGGGSTKYEAVTRLEDNISQAQPFVTGIFKTLGVFDDHPGTAQILQDTDYPKFLAEVNRALKDEKIRSRRAELYLEAAKKYPNSVMIHVFLPKLVADEHVEVAVKQLKLTVPSPDALPVEWSRFLSALGSAEELRGLQMEVLPFVVAAMPNNGTWSRHVPFPSLRYTGPMDEKRFALIEKWFAHSAKTPQQTAWLGTAHAYCAYHYRGQGTYNTIDAKGNAMMAKHGPDASRILKAVIDHGVDVPWVIRDYIVALKVDPSSGAHPMKALPAFDRCIQSFPHDRDLWYAMLDVHRPRWSGDSSIAGPFLHRALDAAATYPDLLSIPFDYLEGEAAVLNPGRRTFGNRDLDALRQQLPWADAVIDRAKKMLRERDERWTNAYLLSIAYYTSDLQLALDVYRDDPQVFELPDYNFWVSKAVPVWYLATALAEKEQWEDSARVLDYAIAKLDARENWATKMGSMEGGIRALRALGRVWTGEDPDRGFQELDALMNSPNLTATYEEVFPAYVMANKREEIEAGLKRVATFPNPESKPIYRMTHAYKVFLDGDKAAAEEEFKYAVDHLLRPDARGELGVPLSRLIAQRFAGGS